VTTETKQHEITPDVSIENCGTLFLFRAETQLGREWINDHVPAGATYWAGQLVVEHRYAYDLAQGMAADGLVLQ
jgi:hypothetical protein